MNNNGKFRQKKVFFTQVSNDALRDPSLSLKAKGLYSLIQSYITLENFILYKNTLKQVCKEGEKAFEASWKELKDRGYLIQYKLRGEKGSFYYEYDLLDYSQTPKKEGVVKVGMDNGVSGKGGQYNNTYPSNTYFKEKEEEAIFIDYAKAKGKRITAAEKDKFRKLLKTYHKDLILKAIDIMITDAEKVTLKYITTCLEDWKSKGIETVEQVNKMRLEWQESKKKGIKKETTSKVVYKSKKESTFNNFEQRDYDFKDLEGKLTFEKESLKDADCSKCVTCQNGRCFLGKTIVNGKCENFIEKVIS